MQNELQPVGGGVGNAAQSDEKTRDAGGKSVGAVVAAAKILRQLADSPEPMGVTQVARATDLYPGTTYNILKTLVAERLVAFDAKAKTYALDVGVLKLAHDLLNRAGILRHVHPILLELCDVTGATAFLLKLLEREELVLIDAASSEGMFDLHISPGRRFAGFRRPTLSRLREEGFDIGR